MGMLADICSDYGLEFPPLSEEGKAGLRNVLPPYAPLANPLDAWGSGDLKEAYPASLSILAREPAVDLLIVSQDMPSNMADEQIAQFSDVAVKAVTYNGQTYGVPYAVESVALVRNDALTSDTPTTYDDLISSGKASGAEYPFIIQMGDKGDPYHFYGFQTSFGAPVFKTNSEGEYTAELAMNGSGGTEFANWLKAQGDAGIVSPSITGDIAKQKFLDGAAAYTVTGPWNVAAFRAAGMKVSVLPVPAAGSQAANPSLASRCSTRAPSPPTRLPPSSSSTTWLPPRPRKRCRSSVAAPPRCPRLPLLPMTRTSRTSPRLLRAARSLPRSLRWVPSGTSGARPRPIS